MSEKSPLLKVAQNLKLSKNFAIVDSLGVFNTNDYFKVDFFLKDISEQKITDEYFNQWSLKGKALDLNVIHDISYIKLEKENPLNRIPSWFWYAYVVMAFFASISMTLIRIFIRRKKLGWIMYPSSKMKKILAELTNIKEQLELLYKEQVTIKAKENESSPKVVNK